MPRPHSHQTPSLFPWMSLPSIPIFHIKMASRHARRFGRKKSQGPTHTDPGQTSDYLDATTSSSTGNIISRSKALLWVPKWHLHTPTFSWVVLRDSCWVHWPWDHFHGWGSLTILTWSGRTAARLWELSSTRPTTSTEHKLYNWNFNQAARVSGHEIKYCGQYNICWSVYKTNRYTPVSPTHKLPPEILLQKCSLQHCTSPQTYMLWFGHFWIKSRPPLEMGLSETGNFTCHWKNTATEERRPTFL